MPRRRRFARIAGTLALALVAGARVSAQDDQPRERSTLATLPQSNEALVLSSRVEQAIQVGDERLAIELIEQIMALPPRLVAAPASRTYYPVWRHAFLLLGKLSPEGVELYHRLYDAEVQARFTEAVAESNVDALRALFRTHRLSSIWPAVGDELTAHLLDRGRFGEAIEVLRGIEWAGAQASLRRKQQLIVALARVGAVQAARKVLESMQGTHGADHPAGAARLDRLAAWIASERRRAGATNGSAAYLLRAGPVWSQAPQAPASFRRLIETDADIADAIDMQQRLPLHEPLVAGETLLFRFRGLLWAYDALTLTQLWQVEERTADGSPFGIQARGPDFIDDGETVLSADARLLLANHFRHTLAADAERVYTLESLTLADTDEGFRQRPFTVVSQQTYRNDLVARDLRSGRVIWRSGESADAALKDAEFQDRPLILDGRVIAPVRRDQELQLVELDAESGELRRAVSIVGPPIHWTRAGGRCLMRADETSIYVCTGNGVVAAVGRDNLEWKWAHVYPSTVAEHLGRLWWKPPVEPKESGIDRPVLADDLIILAPIDSLDVFALDRFSGRERWRMPRREYSFVVGSVSAGLVLGGNGLACLDLADPGRKPLRWKSVPLEITGRPVLRDERVYVPTRQGIVVLDGATGKVLQDQLGAGLQAPLASSGLELDHILQSLIHRPAGAGAANLVVTDDALFAVSPNRITKYASADQTRAACEALLAKSPDDSRARLALAWLDALAGRHAQARQALEAMSNLPARTAESRDRLLSFVHVSLAAAAHSVRERIDALGRAAALAHAPQEAARLNIAIGRGLEREREWRSAFAHYGRMLNRSEPRFVSGPGPDQGSAASWLCAVDRMRSCDEPFRGADKEARREQERIAAARDAFVRVFLADPQTTTEGLMRLRLALQDARQVERALLQRRLAPEILSRYRRRRDDEQSLDAKTRRRLDQVRWEIRVALDERQEAQVARLEWLARYAQQRDQLPVELQDQIASIERSQQKLENRRTVPFTEQLWRQWAVADAELLLDPRQTDYAEKRWLLLRDIDGREIELVNIFSHQQPQRKTADALEDGAPLGYAMREEHERLLSGQRLGWQETGRKHWPMLERDHLAAVPVQGGLVCVGLGPERRGGGRIWEYAVPEWPTISDRFDATSVAGEHGVYFVSRPDRITMVGWETGQPWWHQELRGLNVIRLLIAGNTLVVVSSDLRVWGIDALLGGAPRPLPVERASLRGVEVVDQTIVVWGDTFIAGFDAASFHRIWSRPLVRIARSTLIHGRPWIAYREAGQPHWQVLDARVGVTVFEANLGDFERVSAAAVVGDDLLVAGLVGSEDGEGASVLLTACNAADGAALWSTPLETRVAPNQSQLVGHPEFVPVLLSHVGANGEEEHPGAPAIQLIRRTDGARLEPRSLAGDYEPGPAACDMQLLVTRTRIIVQIDGNTLAYGLSGQ